MGSTATVPPRAHHPFYYLYNIIQTIVCVLNWFIIKPPHNWCGTSVLPSFIINYYPNAKIVDAIHLIVHCCWLAK